MEETTVDPNRENRIHVYSVRYDNNKKKYTVTLKEPTDDNAFDLYDVDWDKWISFGNWEKRKANQNHY